MSDGMIDQKPEYCLPCETCGKPVELTKDDAKAIMAWHPGCEPRMTIKKVGADD